MNGKRCNSAWCIHTSIRKKIPRLSRCILTLIAKPVQKRQLLERGGRDRNQQNDSWRSFNFRAHLFFLFAVSLFFSPFNVRKAQKYFPAKCLFLSSSSSFLFLAPEGQSLLLPPFLLFQDFWAVAGYPFLSFLFHPFSFACPSFHLFLSSSPPKHASVRPSSPLPLPLSSLSLFLWGHSFPPDDFFPGHFYHLPSTQKRTACFQTAEQKETDDMSKN